MDSMNYFVQDEITYVEIGMVPSALILMGSTLPIVDWFFLLW